VVQKELRTCLESEQQVRGTLVELEEEHLSALERFEGTAAGQGISVQELWMSRQMVQTLEGRIEHSEGELAKIQKISRRPNPAFSNATKKCGLWRPIWGNSRFGKRRSGNPWNRGLWMILPTALF